MALHTAEPAALGREDAIRILRGHADAIRARGVSRLALVGSTARDEAVAGSDIDVPVDVDRSRSFSLVEFVDLQDYLADILGCCVDLIERDALDRPEVRDAILRDAVEVFG
jgi:predicted nucleotidyltransferase